MKEFERKEITKERLLSLGFEEYSLSFLLKIDNENFIQIIDNDVSIVNDQKNYDVILLKRKFKYIHEIKELITGLTGKNI